MGDIGDIKIFSEKKNWGGDIKDILSPPQAIFFLCFFIRGET